MVEPARRLHGLSAIVLAAALAAVLFATIGSWASYRQTEQRMLDQRTGEAGAVLSSAVLTVQTPLASAAEVAEASDGDIAAFQAVLGRLVGVGQPFVSAALFAAGSTTPLTVVGDEPVIVGAGTGRVGRVIDAATGADVLGVQDLLDLPGRRIGYTYRSARTPARYVVYAEAALPAEATSVPRATGPFADLDYALYLGPGEQRAELLYASTADLPIDGRRGVTTIPFGTTSIVLVMTPTTVLSGALSRLLPWLIAILGTMLAIGVSVMTERVLRDRDRSRVLATQNADLLTEQRQANLTLQQSLLPGRLGTPPHSQVASRYWPASTDDAIGGDFYDLFRIEGRRWGILIGDVCGKGLEAASITALVRHTVRTAARHLSSSADVLRWAHEAIATSDEADTYATACFGIIDYAPGPGRTADEAELRLAVGGHELPLVVHADGAVDPVGVHGSILGQFTPKLVESRHVLTPGDRLVLFTDGITDAPRGQGVPLAELRATLGLQAGGSAAQIADSIGALVEQRRPLGSVDDIAVLVLGVEARSGVAVGELLARAGELEQTIDLGAR